MQREFPSDEQRAQQVARINSELSAWLDSLPETGDAPAPTDGTWESALDDAEPDFSCVLKAVAAPLVAQVPDELRHNIDQRVWALHGQVVDWLLDRFRFELMHLALVLTSKMQRQDDKAPSSAQQFDNVL